MTWKSNHLRMYFQMGHFLLSSLNALRVGPGGVEQQVPDVDIGFFVPLFFATNGVMVWNVSEIPLRKANKEEWRELCMGNLLLDSAKLILQIVKSVRLGRLGDRWLF